MSRLTELNFHHLRYFWAVALDGNLTRTARRLRVSQSALSKQIRALEDQLGQPLFARAGRRLELTEAGKIALEYADDIFAAGSELLTTLGDGRSGRHVLRIGAVATLSRNFQDSFVAPLLRREDVRISMESGGADELVGRLADHALDVVLTNRPLSPAMASSLRCWQLARQRVSLIGRPRSEPFVWPDDVAGTRLVLPSGRSDIRTAFDAACARLGITVRVFAEVDDMAMLRLLAIDAGAVALLPSVVVRDEITSGVLREHAVVPDLYENFFAITAERRYPHPLLRGLLERDERSFLWRPEPPRGEIPGA